MNIMTPEDFFTLSEMKDGLIAHARVEELVSIMQKEKFSVVKNVSEAARQWSTVASILAATENKDNLDCFIQLGGLWFLDHWLQKAQECSNATRDNTVEESVSALLVALKKLPVDNERSVTCGIRITVKNLLGHQSSRVQERAKALLDSWNQGGNADADHQDVEKEGDGSFDDDAIKKIDATDMHSGSPEHSPVKGSINVDNHGVNLVGGDLQLSRSSEGSQFESVKDVETTVFDDRDASSTSSIWKDENGDQGDPHASSLMPPPCREILSTIAESSIHPEGVASFATCCSPVPVENNVEDRSSDVPQLKDLTQDVKETDTINSPEKNCENKISSFSSVPDPLSSSTNPENIPQSMMTQSPLPIDTDAKNCEIYLKETPPARLGSDSSKLASQQRSEVDEMPKHLSNKAELKATVQAVGCYSSVLQDVSIDCCILRRPEDPDTSFSNEDTGAVNHVKEFAGESCLKGRGGENYATTGKVSKSVVNTKASAMGGKTRLDMELDFMEDDALEVARQVAKEVEREVVDYREPFCRSSSEKIPVDGLIQPVSPESINGKQQQPVMGPSNETPEEQNLLESPNREDHLVSSKILVKPQDSILDQDSSQVTAAAEEPEGSSTKKSICDFDLNKEVYSEQMDHQRSPNAAPITCGSPSKTAASELPAASLHFEVDQGLKGFATTCALFPASSCRTLDAEKELLVDGLKQRQDFRGIDLNVTEGDDFGTIDLVSEKQIQVSSGLPSGKSSIEVSSRRADKIAWDLNLVGENVDASSSDWRTENQLVSHHRDGHHSPSPSSSSSSRQPSMRNIDLNDNPCLCNHYDRRVDLSKSSSLEMNDHGQIQLENPIISIMGARVEINRKEFQPRSNGQVPGYPMGANTMVHSSPSLSVSGCDGLMMGSTVSDTAAMYGPTAVPYIVDARGVPVAPYLMSSPVAVASSYSRPFLVSMTSAPSASNGLESQRPILDLNSGMAVAEGENREYGGLRQLLIPGQGVSSEEQMRSNLQPLSLGWGLKRREPDTGWEKHPMNFKQHSPWR